MSTRLARWRSARDPEALGELLKWQRDRAYAVARRWLNQDSDAEDAVQQAFLKMLSRTHGFETEEEFRTAVIRAVVQCAINLAHGNKTRVRFSQILSQDRQATTAGPETRMEDAEALQWVESELARLDPEDRSVVVLCCQEGFSLSAAAQILEVPRETLRDRLNRSLDELRARLKSRGLPLSLLLLAGLLQAHRVQAAPASLCQALDAVLPGGPCRTIEAAAAPAKPAAALLANAGISGGFKTGLTLKIAAGVLVVAAVTTGGWCALHSQKTEQSIPAAGAVPVTPATVSDQTKNSDAGGMRPLSQRSEAKPGRPSAVSGEQPAGAETTSTETQKSAPVLNSAASRGEGGSAAGPVDPFTGAAPVVVIPRQVGAPAVYTQSGALYNSGGPGAPDNMVQPPAALTDATAEEVKAAAAKAAQQEKERAAGMKSLEIRERRE